MTSGSWSEAAIKEAKKYSKVTECANNTKDKFWTIDDPSTWKIDPEAKYFHFCDNETIQGFEFQPFPFEVIPKGQLVVADMSSNFCSRPIDWQKYDVVYAGSQKNVGPAGVCITIVRKTLLKNACKKDAPLLCDWPLFDKAANTFHNTPNCWSIYMCGLNIDYMIE